MGLDVGLSGCVGDFDAPLFVGGAGRVWVSGCPGRAGCQGEWQF